MAGKTLSELAALFLEEERPVGIVLDEDQATAQAVAAARFCAGYGPIESLVPPAPDPDPNAAAMTLDYFLPLSAGYGYPLPGYPLSPQIVAGSPIAPVDWIGGDTLISQSEWSVIRPLFILYIERENAMLLESTHMFGAEVYGRSSSEINNDIQQMETDPMIAHRMFCQPVISV